MAAASSSSAAAAASTPQGVPERRGIPAASFVEDVETYLRQSGLDVNSALAFLQERLQQYKIVEMKLLAQQRDLQAKIPDIEKCLDIVATLEAKKALGEIFATPKSGISGIITPSTGTSVVGTTCQSVGDTLERHISRNSNALVADFELSEGIYSRANIEDTDSVCLWLGANVMLEYSCDEANALLKKNLENAKASLEVLVADLQFLRDQQTITQVTIARVFNWDVHQRRSKQAMKET